MRELLTLLFRYPLVHEEYWVRCHVSDLNVSDIVITYSLSRREVVVVVQSIYYEPCIQKMCVRMVEPFTDFQLVRTGPEFRVISPGLSTLKQRRLERILTKLSNPLSYLLHPLIKYFI